MAEMRDGLQNAVADSRCAIGIRFALKGICRDVWQLDSVAQVSIAAILFGAKENEEESVASQKYITTKRDHWGVDLTTFEQFYIHSKNIWHTL